MKGTRWCSHTEANGISRTMTISSCSAAKVTVRCRPGSSAIPLKSSSYMAATRVGVLSSPSRSGSSPMAARISLTARATRAVSTGALFVPFPVSTRALLVWAIGSAGFAEIGVDRGQVAVALVDVEPIADDEVRRDRESAVAQRQVDVLLLLLLLHQQGAHLQAGRAPGLEVPAQVVEREATVDDVLDDEHVATGQIGIQVLHDAHDAGRA